MKSKNKINPTNILLFGSLGFIGYKLYNSFSEDEDIIPFSSGGSSDSFKVQDSSYNGSGDITPMATSQEEIDTREKLTKKESNQKLFQEVGSLTGSARIIDGKKGTQIQTIDTPEVRQRVSRSSGNAQVTLTDDKGSAQIVMDTKKKVSRSADYGFSQVGGGVGFSAPKKEERKPSINLSSFTSARSRIVNLGVNR